MTLITENKNLQKLNTFGINVIATHYTEIYSVNDFKDLLHDPVYKSNKKLIIGGGSNILFTKDFEGLVIQNKISGIEITKEDNQHVYIKAGAGENWHQFVMWCVKNGFAGLENLSLIPGCVGASPMQNIGAYGVEIKELFYELEACDLNTGEVRQFTRSECKFGYRESVFKRELKDRYLITSVTYCLNKNANINVSYGAISSELQAAGIQAPNIKDVSDAVIRIRQSKLPDPNIIGNAGSFFKNPEIKAAQHVQLIKNFPDMVAYPLQDGNFKLAAGWLIEQCGLKGFEHGGAAVHTKQALVLINLKCTSGKNVLELSEIVMQKVKEKFGVQLEREVNII